MRRYPGKEKKVGDRVMNDEMRVTRKWGTGHEEENYRHGDKDESKVRSISVCLNRDGTKT